MTEECPVPHDEKAHSGSILFNTQAAQRRLLAGEDSNTVFLDPNGDFLLYTSEIGSKGDPFGLYRARMNTIFSFGATDSAARLREISLWKQGSIPSLKTDLLPLDDTMPVDIEFLRNIANPLVSHVIDTEASAAITFWNDNPQLYPATQEILKRITYHVPWSVREFIKNQLLNNLDTARRIKPFLHSLVYTYYLQIEDVDPTSPPGYPSLQTFQELFHESKGLLLRQATRDDHYFDMLRHKTISQKLGVPEEIRYTENLLLQKKPNGKLQVSLTPQARKEVEDEWEQTKPEFRHQVITGCPAMPLIQTILQRVDSYIEAFKEE